MKKYAPVVLAVIAFVLLLSNREHATFKPEEPAKDPKKEESTKKDTAAPDKYEK